MLPLTGNLCSGLPTRLAGLSQSCPEVRGSSYLILPSLSPFTDHRPSSQSEGGSLEEEKLKLGLPGWPGKKAFHVEGSAGAQEWGGAKESFNQGTGVVRSELGVGGGVE